MYRIEVYWKDTDGCLHNKGYSSIQQVINFVTHEEYIYIDVGVAYGNPPTLDVERIGFDGSRITYIDVCIEKAVELYNTYKNDSRVCVVLHPKENEKMKTETNWVHYENELYEAVKYSGNYEFQCEVRKLAHKYGGKVCGDFNACRDCKKDSLEWLHALYEPPKMLENGNNLTVGQYIRVSKCGTYDDSFKVQFLYYYNGMFYVVPQGHDIETTGCHDRYRYAWPCTD